MCTSFVPMTDKGQRENTVQPPFRSPTGFFLDFWGGTRESQGFEVFAFHRFQKTILFGFVFKKTSRLFFRVFRCSAGFSLPFKSFRKTLPIKEKFAHSASVWHRYTLVRPNFTTRLEGKLEKRVGSFSDVLARENVSFTTFLEKRGCEKSP